MFKIKVIRKDYNTQIDKKFMRLQINLLNMVQIILEENITQIVIHIMRKLIVNVLK